MYSSITLVSRIERLIRGCTADTEVVRITRTGVTERALKLLLTCSLELREGRLRGDRNWVRKRAAGGVMDAIQDHQQRQPHCHRHDVAGGK